MNQNDEHVTSHPESKRNIYGECWTIFIAFQMKKTPESMFILFIFTYISFGDEKKRHNLQLMPL